MQVGEAVVPMRDGVRLVADVRGARARPDEEVRVDVEVGSTAHVFLPVLAE